MGQGKVIFLSKPFSERRNDTAGQKCLSPAKGRNTSNCFSLFQSKLSWRPQDTLRESQAARESGALGRSSAAELGWAPGMEGVQGNQAALQKDSSAQEQLLCKAQQG